jgi:hypothetical protein
LGKKKSGLEALMEKIIAQHIKLDQGAAEEKDLTGAPIARYGSDAWQAVEGTAPKRCS